MLNRILLAMSVVALIAIGLVFAAPPAAAAGEAKNLQVLSKDLTKKQLKAIMKNVSKAVGASCDGCHDLEDFSKDSELKKRARSMFRMTNSINAKLKKDGFKKRVKCVTCHAGKAKP